MARAACVLYGVGRNEVGQMSVCRLFRGKRGVPPVHEGGMGCTKTCMPRK